MVLPITGPTVVSTASPGVYTKTQRQWRQAKPFNIDMEYLLYLGVVTGSHGTGMGTPDASWVLVEESKFLPPDVVTHASNKAYAKLRDSAGDSASLGATLREFGQSADMITSRAIQLAKIFKAARNLNLVRGPDSLSAQLGLTKSQRRRAEKYVVSRDVSGLILEVNYGWIPLAGDIQTSLEAYISAEPWGKLKGVAGVLTSYDTGNTVVTDDSPDFHSEEWRRGQGRYLCKQQCKVQVSNPNLWLLNSLGLVNPVSVLYETTYMSHVLDWFTGIGAVINSATDWVGLSLKDGLTTTHHVYDYAYTSYLRSSGTVYRDGSTSWKGVSTKRSLGITYPRINPRWGIRSWSRATNAWAQLVQQLPRK